MKIARITDFYITFRSLRYESSSSSDNAQGQPRIPRTPQGPPPGSGSDSPDDLSDADAAMPTGNPADDEHDTDDEHATRTIPLRTKRTLDHWGMAPKRPRGRSTTCTRTRADHKVQSRDQQGGSNRPSTGPAIILTPNTAWTGTHAGISNSQPMASNQSTARPKAASPHPPTTIHSDSDESGMF